MDDVRKERCSTCGWSKIIVEREERPYATRTGTKEILICKECQVMKNSTNQYARAAFQEYYSIAVRGTKPAIPVEKMRIEVLKFDSPADDPLSGAAITNFDKDNKPKRGFDAWRNSGIERTYTSIDLRKWFRRGTAVGALWCAMVVGALIQLGVLHW